MVQAFVAGVEEFLVGGWLIVGLIDELDLNVAHIGKRQHEIDVPFFPAVYDFPVTARVFDYDERPDPQTLVQYSIARSNSLTTQASWTRSPR